MAEEIDAALVRAARLVADGLPAAAIELLRPLIAAHPEHSAAWCRLSAAYLEAGSAGESLAAAKRAIILGERSWAHRLASLALVELGRLDEAVASALEAVHRDPVDWRCQVTLAEALAPTEPDEALKVALTAIDLAPRQARPHEVAGDIAVTLGDTALAKRAYRDALRHDPGNDHVAASLARLDSRVRPTPKPPPAPRISRPAARPVPFGRAQRVALWLLVRRVAVWLTAGSLVLLIAGLPSPSPPLVWFGLGLMLFVLGLAGHGWLTLPPGARVGLRVVRRIAPTVPVSVALLGVAVLLLAVWVAALALGSRGVQLLGVVLACSAVSAGLAGLGLWRLKVRTR